LGRDDTRQPLPGGLRPAAGRASRGDPSGRPSLNVARLDVEQAIRTRRTHKCHGGEPVAREALEELLELAPSGTEHNPSPSAAPEPIAAPVRMRALRPKAGRCRSGRAPGAPDRPPVTPAPPGRNRCLREIDPRCRRSSPASVSSADIDALAGNPRCDAGWISTSSTWSWRRTGRRTRVSSTAARPRNATPGWARGSSATWSRGHRWSGPRGSGDRASRCRGAAGGRCESGCGSHGVVGWSAPRIYVDGRRVRAVRGRGVRARQSSSSAFRAAGSGSRSWPGREPGGRCCTRTAIGRGRAGHCHGRRL
jgi:hypothetical protein